MDADQLRRLSAPGINSPQLLGEEAGGQPSGSSGSSGGWNPFGSGKPKRTPTFIPGAAGGQGGYRVQDESGNWVFPSPEEMVQNGTNYSDNGTEAASMRNHLKGVKQGEADAAEKTRIKDADDKKYALLLAGQERDNVLAKAQLARIEQEGKATADNLALLTTKLGIEDGNADADRADRSSQANALLAQQTRQLELNNDLLREKLGVEDRHFQQQLGLDERNARRTKVLGSLTLIAQSLQRL